MEYSKNKDAIRYRQLYQKSEKYVEKQKKKATKYYKEHQEQMDKKQKQYYEISRKQAHNSGDIWTEYEDRFILEHYKKDMTINEIAISIGRSFSATKTRIYKIRKKEKLNENKNVSHLF